MAGRAADLIRLMQRAPGRTVSRPSQWPCARSPTACVGNLPQFQSTCAGNHPDWGRFGIRVICSHKPEHGSCPERLTLLDAGAWRVGRQGTRTAFYLRVSTADQKPDLQYDGLRGYAERAGLNVVQDYFDVAVSGRLEGRPQLNAVMATARNREIDCVLVILGRVLNRPQAGVTSRFVRDCTLGKRPRPLVGQCAA